MFDTRHVDRLASAELLAALVEDDEAPWATWNRGKPMTLRQLVGRLREFGVGSHTIRFGYRTAKGYLRNSLEEVFRRYLCPESVTPSQTSNSAASGDFSSVTAAAGLRKKNGHEPSNGAACDPVTDRRGATGKEDAWEVF